MQHSKCRKSLFVELPLRDRCKTEERGRGEMDKARATLARDNTAFGYEPMNELNLHFQPASCTEKVVAVVLVHK